VATIFESENKELDFFLVNLVSLFSQSYSQYKTEIRINKNNKTKKYGGKNK